MAKKISEKKKNYIVRKIRFKIQNDFLRVYE